MTTLELTPTLALPQVPGFTFRPVRYEDLPALHELMLACSKADKRDRVDSVEDLQTQFDDPWSNPVTDSIVGFTATGQLVAFGRSFVPPEPQGEAVSHLWFEIHPGHRAPTLIDPVFDWLTARASERVRAIPANLPRSIRTGTQDDNAWYIALLEGRGFRPIRYFYRMRRDLHEPIPAGPLAEGLVFTTYTPELDYAMYSVFQAAFRDHWGFQSETYDEWQQFFVKRASFRPDLSLLVMDGAEAVGISYNTANLADNTRNGINEAWIGDLAVLRSHRKRGLATALLCESMRRFKAEGFDFATLGVDSENPTGALGVYERVGFKVARRMMAMDKKVA